MTAELMWLSGEEAHDLAQLEDTIARGLGTFVEVGTALTVIRDRRLHRQTHSTFEGYCADNWGMSRPRAYELMSAAATVSALSDMPDTPPVENARQAAALAPIIREHGPEAAAEVLAQAAAAGPVTAASIRQAAEETGRAKVTQTARTTEATKVEHLVDTETGEILAVDTPRGPAPSDESRRALQDFIEADPGHNDRRYVINYLKALTPVTDLPKYDADKLARLLNSDEFFITEKSITALNAWLARVRAGRHPHLIGVQK